VRSTYCTIGDNYGTDGHEASRGLSATAELLIHNAANASNTTLMNRPKRNGLRLGFGCRFSAAVTRYG